MLAAVLLGRIGFRMVSSYPLPEGFTEFDVFSLGSCLLVEGERASVRLPVRVCSVIFVLESSQRLPVYGACARCINLMRDLTPPR